MDKNIPTVLCFEDARRRVDEFDAVLSIWDDPKYSVAPTNIDVPYLSLRMFDVTPAKFYGQPHKLDIYKQVLDVEYFFKTLGGNDRLMIHCKWGVSRSAAFGCMKIMRNNIDEEEALEMIREKSPRANPNWYYMAVIREILQIGR